MSNKPDFCLLLFVIFYETSFIKQIPVHPAVALRKSTMLLVGPDRRADRFDIVSTLIKLAAAAASGWAVLFF
jgi:hypothetical protein